MENKYNEKLDIIDGSVAGVPTVEYGQVLEYPNEDVKEHRGDLHRTFKARHIQMICLGGCIGSGIFISTGKALRYGNYTGMFIGWTLICTMSWTVMQVMSEACCIFPTSGAFVDHAARFVDPALGFAIGFCEWFGWITVVAAEGAVFRVIISYWTELIPTAACMTIYLVVVFAIHIFPNKMFAEFEFGTAAIKVVAMIVILLTCIAIVAGAGSTGSTHHAENYTSLPAFPHGFKGVAQSFLLAAWSTGGQEIMGITNGEADMPRWNLPRACKNLLIRIFVFYLGSVTLITVLVPYTDPRLLGTSSIAASPFVIAMNDAGIKVLPDILNVVVLVGLCAIGAESLYISSRISTAMARMHMFPKIFGRIDTQGRPYMSLLIAMALSTIMTYINCSNTGAVIFTWFSSITATVYFLAYMTICISNWRMRAAFKAQNDNPLTLQYAYKNKFFPLGSVFLFISSIFVLASTFYVSLFPIGAPTTAENFFETFLCVPLFLVLYLGYKIVYKTKFVDPKEADLQTGRRPLTESDIAFLEAYYSQPWHKRALTYLTF
ncbi:AAT family amino acid transporter [Mollisia scopiformis]|uniref:AAT family amino acid transporter n=1 Tax=Mollisia scopiformis TaxID=149040 RepID=A0A132B3D5_MOLSC|nr:AAT family amino acid transporter [Mollisia scopiformis]KUJ06915.1 AAT family amino acid transporter [Mollisia scopiformis]